MHGAASRGNVAAVALLLAAPGNNPLAKSMVGWRRATILFLSSYRRAYCLQNGSPLDAAKRNNHAAVVAMLKTDPRVVAAVGAAASQRVRRAI